MGYKVEILEKKPHIDDNYHFKSIFYQQLQELAEINNPSLSSHQIDIEVEKLKKHIKPIYVVFSWKNTVLECVPEEYFIKIKTNRNQYLILEDEQSKLYNQKISIAGMSVGSSQLFGLVGSGFGNKFAIADDDKYSTSNLNRVQATILEVGDSKVETSQIRALEMNPFVEIKEYKTRITENNVEDFLFNGESAIIFEEIDDFKMKVVFREQAKKFKIPLVMLTNLGDNVMIDVERYDTDSSTTPFNGLVDNELILKIKNTEIDLETMKMLSVALVDRKLLSERAIKTVSDIGTKVVGRPQLYGTVALDGGIAPYILRKIVLGGAGDFKSGRYYISLNEALPGE